MFTLELLKNNNNIPVIKVLVHGIYIFFTDRHILNLSCVFSLGFSLQEKTTMELVRKDDQVTNLNCM